MPRSTHARRTKEGLPSSLDKVFPCLWGLEDYVHPRPGPAEPFHSAFLSGLRCCLASAGVLGVSLPGDLPSSFLAGSLPALPLGSFPWFLYHRKPGPAGSYYTYFPLPLLLCSSQTWGNDFPLAPQGFSLLHFPSLHRRGCGLRVFHSISFFIIFTPFGWFASEGLGGLTGQSDFIMSPSSSYH